MLLLDKNYVKENNQDSHITYSQIDVDHKSETCFYDDTTLVCGKSKNVDYFVRIESKMIPEPFYGDIDLFGF